MADDAKKFWFWWAILTSWFFAVLSVVVFHIIRATLEPSWVTRAQMGVPIALVMALPLIAVCLAPQIGVWLIGRSQGWPSRLVAILQLVPGLLMFLMALQGLFPSPPARMAKGLKSITTLELPPNSTIAGVFHGHGMQDRRHLWLISGAQSDYQEIISDREWAHMATEQFGEPLSNNRWFPLSKIERFVAPIKEWTVLSALDTDLGTLWIISNPDRTRWAVWWDGV